MSEGRVLVVDDDADIRELVHRLLERVGYDVHTADDGRAALRAFHEQRPDLVVLDVNLPGLTGWETLERIRDLSDVPVLMLTAHGGELEKVRGLEAGADDYVAKPFGRQELVARVRALLRRPQRAEPERELYADGLLEVDFADRRVKVAHHEVQLTPLEFKLLGAFVRHPNQVLTHAQLLELVWGGSYAVSRDQVKLYVGYLRRKLRTEAGEPTIETVRGFGYRFRPAPA